MKEKYKVFSEIDHEIEYWQALRVFKRWLSTFCIMDLLVFVNCKARAVGKPSIKYAKNWEIQGI